MKNLLTAIYNTASSASFFTTIGGRFFLDEAPPEAEYPYVVFSIVSSGPEDTFVKDIEDTTIQFSIYSTSRSGVEISDLHDALKTYFKDRKITVTGGTNVMFAYLNLVTMVDPITTKNGMATLKHWAVDFSVMVQKS
jgi:hypothetical protein